MRSPGTILSVVTALGSLLVFVDSAQAIKVLMHGRDPAATFRDDPFSFAILEAKFGVGNVTYMQGSTAAADGSSANGFDVVYISSSMASSDTRNKYEDSLVGVVCSENALIHDNNLGNFMLSDAGGNQDATPSTMGRNKINILDPTHPIAAGLSGEVTVFNTTPTDTYWWQFARGQLAPGVDRVAESLLDVGSAAVSGDFTNDFLVDAADYVTFRKFEGAGSALPNDNGLGTPISSGHETLWRQRFGDSSAANDAFQHAILAAEVGEPLWGDGSTGSPATAPGRRVFFFLSDFGAFDLTDDGKKLFEAAVEWAGTDPGPGGGSGVPEPACVTLWAIGLGVCQAFRRRWPRAN